MVSGPQPAGEEDEGGISHENQRNATQASEDSKASNRGYEANRVESLVSLVLLRTDSP